MQYSPHIESVGRYVPESGVTTGLGAAGLGVVVLLLVLVLFGFSFFQNGDTKNLHTNLRELGNESHGDAVTAATFRGATAARQQDMYNDIRALSAKTDGLAIGLTQAVNTSREGVLRTELFGVTNGFRNYGVGCGDRHCHDKRRTVTIPYIAPTEISETTDIC